jgi:FixJ family two-component response regulator
MGKAPVIAVVDDDASVRAALASLLRSAGFVVLLFASAEEFLNESDNLPPIGCLVLDWRMPGMDGLQLQRTLNLNGRRVPTIFLTAHGDAARRAQAVSGGAIAFLPKPFDADVLLHAVKSGIEAR